MFKADMSTPWTAILNTSQKALNILSFQFIFNFAYEKPAISMAAGKHGNTLTFLKKLHTGNCL